MAVEINEELDTFGSPIIYIKDPEKKAATYRVYKGQNGFAFYEIGVDKGQLPKALTSQYTNMKDAERAVIRHLEISPKSATVKRDENTAAREARKQRELEENS